MRRYAQEMTEMLRRRDPQAYRAFLRKWRDLHQRDPLGPRHPRHPMRMQRIPGNVRRRSEFAGPPELARFFRGDRLEVIPRRETDRRAVLGFIAQRFERGRDYPEAEVNSLLLSAHDDIAMLRRYLVDAGLLTRTSGRYRRA